MLQNSVLTEKTAENLFWIYSERDGYRKKKGEIGRKRKREKKKRQIDWETERKRDTKRQRKANRPRDKMRYGQAGRKKVTKIWKNLRPIKKGFA